MPLYSPAAPPQPWIPADDGLLTANYSPEAVGNGNAIMIAGTVYLLRLNIRAAITATNICIGITTAGNNTGNSTGTFAGLYSSAGTLLSGSSDVAGSLTSTGFKSLALTTPQPLAAGTYVWAALLANLGTTQPTLAQTSINTAGWGTLGQSAANLRFTVNGTSVTALPSPSITPGSNATANTHAFWIGIT